MPDATRGTQAEVPVESTPPPSPPEGGFNLGLASLLIGIVVLVCIQNIWLARRAERERRARDESPP